MLGVADALLGGLVELLGVELVADALALDSADVVLAAALPAPDESPPRATMVTSQITIASATTMTPIASARRRQ